MQKVTKKEIRARIKELNIVLGIVNPHIDGMTRDVLNKRIDHLTHELENAPEDFFDAVLESHKAVCEAKNMGPKEAYRQDPIMYYTLACSGEIGELANKIVKGHRNGYNLENAREAVISELPDVFIYATVLAHISDIDIVKLVNEKVEIVIERAKSGYYGGPL